MNSDRFENFANKLLNIEGGYVNNVNDSGGETKYGISKRTYPDLDIKNLTIEKAKEIYWKDYYSVLKIQDVINEGVAWQLFDFGFNSGVENAARGIQRIVGTTIDGIIGSKTINKINTFVGNSPLEKLFVIQRIKYYMNIILEYPKNKVFLEGWLNRILINME